MDVDLSVGKPPRRSRKPMFHRLILISMAGALLVALIIAVKLFQFVLSPNVITKTNQPVSIYIKTGSTFKDVLEILYGQQLISNQNSFEWVAGRKNYPASVRPGHYVILPRMNNNELVNMLRSGAQEPIRVIFNNIRKKEDLAGRISRQIEADSISLIRCWNDRDFLRAFHLTPDDVITIFIPDTYEFWWNTGAEAFTERMFRESEKFWAGKRDEKAREIKMSRKDIIILASIIEKETQKNDEKGKIAGVYINRLRKGWPLQADPTVVYALGDFGIKRILTVHTRIESPYNTYLHTGLPPGPICLPSVASIDAVINYSRHDYMFFCAKSDMSGYHVFSRTLQEHNRNARAYQNALDQRRVF